MRSVCGSFPLLSSILWRLTREGVAIHGLERLPDKIQVRVGAQKGRLLKVLEGVPHGLVYGAPSGPGTGVPKRCPRVSADYQDTF